MKKIIRRNIILLLIFIILSQINVFAKSNDSIILKSTDSWYYFDEKEDLGKEWLKSDFNFKTWKQGDSPLGFGDLVSETDPNVLLATEIGFGGDEKDKQMTTYFKTAIDVEDLKNYEYIKIYLHVDDGCIVYFNGKEAFRRGIEEGVKVDYNTPFKFKEKEEIFYIPSNLLKEGKNIISSEVHQSDNTSSDLWFEMEMTLTNDIVEKIDYTKTNLPNMDVEVGDVSRVTMTFFQNPAKDRGFTWYTNQRSIASDLYIVEESDNNFDNPIKFKGSYYRSTNSPEYIVHKAIATGLKPNTKYKFKVGDEKLNIWSDIGSFRTSELGYGDGKFSFIDLADSQAKNEEEAILSSETFRKANNKVENSEFMILNGDIVDTGIIEEQWGWLLDHSKDTLLNTTFVPAAGNHDTGKNAFIDHFNISYPEDSSIETGVYYSFNYENSHFIVLNNNEDSDEYRNFTPKQISWLKEDIKKAKKDENINWIIAVMHKGPYTTSNHGTDKDITDKENGVRYKVAPLFSDLGIDIVLQGHDHIYARSKPISDNKVGKYEKDIRKYKDMQVEYTINPEGTIYVIPSTAGPKVYYKNKDLGEDYYRLFEVANEHSASKYGNDDGKNRPKRSQVQNFIEFNIDNNKLTAIGYEIDQNLNNKEPFIIDTFGIIKEKIKKEDKKSNKIIPYQIKKGDMLWKIGRRFGVDYRNIQKYNSIKDPNLIYAGDLLEIPVKN